MAGEKIAGYQITDGNGFWGNYGLHPSLPAMTKLSAEQFAREQSTQEVMYVVTQVPNQERVHYVEDEQGNVMNAFTGEIIRITRRVRG